MTDINGAVPRPPAELAARAHETTERMASELRELIAAEQVGRIDYERQVHESRDRERQYRKVLAALEGTAPKVGRPTKAEKAARAKQDSVSEEKVIRALEVLSQASGPLTMRQIKDAMGVGATETAAKAIRVLRERDQVRMAGVARIGPNGQPARTFTAMPGAGDGSA